MLSISKGHDDFTTLNGWLESWQKPLMLSISMGHDDFTTSNGWLEPWQKRFSVRLATLCGEAADVPEHNGLYEAAVESVELKTDFLGILLAQLFDSNLLTQGDDKPGYSLSTNLLSLQEGQYRTAGRMLLQE